MSGAMCPDCGQSDFKHVTAGPCFGSLKSPYDQGQMCGWIGRLERLPRKMPTMEMLEQLSGDRDLKKQNALFFVRGYLKKDASNDSEFMLMHVLGARSSSSSSSAGISGFLMRLESRPSEESLAKAKTIIGIERIEVW